MFNELQFITKFRQVEQPERRGSTIMMQVENSVLIFNVLNRQRNIIVI